MPDDPSHQRRELAAERLALAKQIPDPNIRASVLGMAQKWLDLAQLEPCHDDEALFRAIQAKIGHELRAQYELPQGLPQRLVGLLMQLDT